MTAPEIIETFINGNLSLAEEKSQFVSTQSLVDAGQMHYDYNRSLILASYLKGHISFQDYCNNFNNK